MGEWANRHINWAWFLANTIGGFVVGFIFGFIGIVVLAYVAGIIIGLVTTFWLLDRKGQSMLFIIVYFIPFGWIVLLSLENKREITGIQQAYMENTASITSDGASQTSDDRNMPAL